MDPKPGNGLRETVEFVPNTPVELALKFGQGKEIQTRNGPRYMFSLTDGRVMFLDPEPAAKVQALGAKPGEKICVSMQWNGKRGDPREWTVWLATDTELRRAQAEAREKGDRWTERKLEDKMVQREKVQAIADPPAAPPIPKAAGVAPAQMLNADSLALLSEARQLIDVYWFALAYARKEYGDGMSDSAVLALVQGAQAARRKGGK